MGFFFHGELADPKCLFLDEGRIVPLNCSAACSPPPQQPPPQERQPEEQIEFDHRPQGHTQTTDQHMAEHQQKSAPGDSGPTDMTPPKKKSADTNATVEHHANANTPPVRALAECSEKSSQSKLLIDHAKTASAFPSRCLHHISRRKWPSSAPRANPSCPSTPPLDLSFSSHGTHHGPHPRQRLLWQPPWAQSRPTPASVVAQSEPNLGPK
jgi:hypothetical protein